MRQSIAVCRLLLPGLLAGCDGTVSDPKPDSLPPGFVAFHFAMHGDTTGLQDFRAITDDPAVIATAREQLALPENDRHLFIIGGIARGNAGYNLAWSWHFQRSDWDFAEVAIELCDGNAVLVEQAVDYWVDTVGLFCPWGSFVSSEVPPAS